MTSRSPTTAVKSADTTGQPVGSGADASAAQVSAGKVGGSDPVLERVLTAWPAGRIDTITAPNEWTYEEGVLLDGMTAEWRVTGDGRLFAYVKAAVDQAVDTDGVIHVKNGAAFPVEQHSMDNIEMGRAVLTVYRVTQEEKYYKAAKFLHDQMLAQPKNARGGYWHKQIYPNQMWLDGAYMSEPFMEGYGNAFNHPAEMDAAVSQLLLMDEHMRDRKTGLYGMAGTHR